MEEKSLAINPDSRVEVAGHGKRRSSGLLLSQYGEALEVFWTVLSGVGSRLVWLMEGQAR